ncbi:hypothetical protein J6590_103892 [Homalodisca vitripennis]|nr:hypothetical protein J6590_103892 [Homalodisca vitripennis]
MSITRYKNVMSCFAFHWKIKTKGWQQSLQVNSAALYIKGQVTTNPIRELCPVTAGGQLSFGSKAINFSSTLEISKIIAFTSYGIFRLTNEAKATREFYKKK